MLKRIFRLILTLIGIGIGFGLVGAVNDLFLSWGYAEINSVFLPWAVALIYACVSIIFGIIFFIYSPRFINQIIRLVQFIETAFSGMTLIEIMLCVAGFMVGILIAFIFMWVINIISIPYVSLLLNVISFMVFGYLGWSIVYKRKSEVASFFKIKRKESRERKTNASTLLKVLDTSAIIDGRILDVCLTGFVEGIIVVPSFVLDELRHIADSDDPMRRQRGRRGLDVLAKMQNESKLPMKVEEKDYDDISEVDSKLIRLAYEIGGAVVTNDYNLNKVAAVQAVPVLNVNDLANAVKSVLLPGEELIVSIIKEGKEREQGVAYLEDGTMIVVENAKNRVGETIPVTVTSVLQTSAGRMIFAK